MGNDPRSSRQFNPIKQAKDYDSQSEYVRLWVPELKDVPDDHVQTPWGEPYLIDFKSPLADDIQS